MQHSYDYIVVGLGLAGIAMTEVLLQHGKSVLVIDKGVNHSTRTAAGVINAVILKRFTLVNHAQEQIDLAFRFYKDLEHRFHTRFLYEIATLRRLASVEEQNNFIAASDRPLFERFLSSKILANKNPHVKADYGFGEMRQTGYLDTNMFLDVYRSYLKESHLLLEESFDFSQLLVSDGGCVYKELSCNRIIFAEGFSLSNNPYFGYLPLDGAKGELLLIKAPGLQVESLLKSDIFVLPVGNDLYKVGATYNWEDKSNSTTAEARVELVTKLNDLITCEYEIIDQYAGVRPTVKDRNPLLGAHPKCAQLYVFNGLGTRGVMLAPYYAQMLFDFIEDGVALPSHISINRFTKKYFHEN